MEAQVFDYDNINKEQIIKILNINLQFNSLYKYNYKVIQFIIIKKFSTA